MISTTWTDAPAGLLGRAAPVAPVRRRRRVPHARAMRGTGLPFGGFCAPMRGIGARSSVLPATGRRRPTADPRRSDVIVQQPIAQRRHHPRDPPSGRPQS